MEIRVGWVALLALSTACGGGREGAWETTTPAPAEQTEEAKSRRAVLLEEAASSWEGRDDETKTKAAIEKWKEALSIDPNDVDNWVMLSRGYYFLADCHERFAEGGEEAVNAQLVETFEQGIKASERALAVQSDDFATRMREGTKIEDALDILGIEAVPALYWRSANMGKWGGAKGFATVLAHKDEVRAVMTHCLELAPSYWFAGPHRYFGAFFARVPAFAGGDLERSKEHFEKSIAAEPNYFATRVLMAEDYAVKSQNRALFEEQLNYVIEGDPESIPIIAPENRCEQKKAKLALQKADEVFE